MSPIWRMTMNSCLSAGVCAGAAVLLCALMNNGWEFRVAAALIGLQAVIVASLIWGRLPGFIGAVSAGLVFYIWLFPPVGTLAIENTTDLIILLLFQLAGFAIVFLSPRSPVRMAPLGGQSYRLILRRQDKRRNKNSE